MKDDRVYLRHILRCISRIQQYTAAGRDCAPQTLVASSATVITTERARPIPKRHSAAPVSRKRDSYAGWTRTTLVQLHGDAVRIANPDAP